jgi:hypothetical protein
MGRGRILAEPCGRDEMTRIWIAALWMMLVSDTPFPNGVR